MMDKLNYERSEGFCSRKCRSVEHAEEISSAILKGNEDQAIAFMCWRCSNYSRVTDEAGRTALHIAASCGKTKVLAWILKNLGNESGINAKDYESRYTPLHRGLFHGQLDASRYLIKHGAKLTALDNDGMMPLDHVIKDRPTGACSSGVPLEAFVWGSNRNFNLGIGNNESRRFPDTVDFFRRSNVNIKMVAMGKFHSIFVSSDGRAFSCGHGKGRLGLNSEETVMVPKQITLYYNDEVAKGSNTKYQVVVSASVGQDHSLLLTSKGTVYTFGVNSHFQLGLDPPPPVQLTPKSLNSISSEMTGIKAARYHSMAWNDTKIYTWGSNHGQLGHSRDERYVVSAKVLPCLRGAYIVSVSAGDSATVIGSSRGDIFVLQDYFCRKIGTIRGVPRRIEVVGGRLDPALIKSEDVSGWGDYRSGKDELYILILDKSKKLMLWWASNGHFNRCDLRMGNRRIDPDDIALGTDKLLVVTEEGDGFEAEFKIKKRHEEALPPTSERTTLQMLVEKDRAVEFEMKKIMFIHRASSVYCSPKSLNFAIVQFQPYFLLKRPEAEKSVSVETGLCTLLEEAEESDFLSDIVFSVDGVRIPAHRFILESNSKSFASLITSAEKMQASLQQSDGEVDGNNYRKKQCCVTVKIEGINPVIFKEVLMYVYTGMCVFCIPQLWTCEKDSEYFYFESHMKGTWKVSPVVCDDQARCLSIEEIAKARGGNLGGSSDLESNPVRDARRAAARFGLNSLVHLLDGLLYNKAYCNVLRKPVVPSSLDEKASPKILLSPNSCTHLYDVVMECEGAKVIKAHKCVLAMRSKYFETMFKGDWIECSGCKNIMVPFSYEVMQAIILFLYQNKIPTLTKSDDVAFLWNVLIASDQILLEGLKDICEVLLANHITLKNVSEFYQMSDTYNAGKLKQFCVEYMSANVPALLECRALDDIDPELFDDLQLHYWATRPVVLKRFISPPSKYPDLSTLQNILEAVGKPSEEEHFRNSESALRKEAVEASKRNRAKRKQKSRPTSLNEKAGHLSRLSMGSNYGLESEVICQKCDGSVPEIDICEPFDELMKISFHEESGKDIGSHTQDRSWAKNDIVPAPQEPSPMEIVPEKNIMSVHEEDFPVLSSDAHQVNFSASSKTPKNRKMTKMSQKERKRQLSSASANKKSDENGDPVPKPEVNPWRKLNSSSHEGSPVQVESPSLSEIMNEERRRRRPPRKLHHDENPSEDAKLQGTSMLSQNMEASPVSPSLDGARGGGWPTTPPSAEEQAMGPKSFNEIVADEIKQREMTKKMMDKPLNLTLMEDRAMKELQMSYERDYEHDERITVRRVPSAQVSKPVWYNSKSN